MASHVGNMTAKGNISDAAKIKKILYSLFFFFIAGLCEIGGGYLVWLMMRLFPGTIKW